MLEIVISSDLRLSAGGLPPAMRALIMSDLTVANPAYANALRQGRSTRRIPPHIHLYRLEGDMLVLPRGYVGRLRALLEHYGVAHEWHDERLVLAPVRYEWRGSLRDYQQRAVDALVSGEQGGVVAPCGSGKTHIMLATIARLQQPTIWITHTRDLAEQAIQRAVETMDVTEDEIGRIYSGECRIGTRLTVALVQSISRMRRRELQELAQHWGAVVIDEAHHVPASTFYSVVTSMPARYRLWCSATPERSDGLTPMLIYGGGPVLCEIPQDEIPSVIPYYLVIPTNYVDYELDYAKLMSNMSQDPQRNSLIVRTIARYAPGHSSLVLSERIEHVQVLAMMLAKAMPSARIAILSGSLSRQEREAVVAQARNREVDILLATRLAREGLDLPHLDRLFLVMPKRASSTVQQEVGRIMRPAEGKSEALVVDFWDSKVPLVRKQYYARLSVYRQLGMQELSKIRAMAL